MNKKLFFVNKGNPELYLQVLKLSKSFDELSVIGIWMNPKVVYGNYDITYNDERHFAGLIKIKKDDLSNWMFFENDKPIERLERSHYVAYSE